MKAEDIAHNYFKHLERAQFFMDVDRWREALHELDQHLAEFPDSYGGLCQSALCHLSLKEYQQGYDKTKLAIAADPDNEWAYRLQSIIFRENNEPKRALDAAKLAVEKAPASPVTVNILFWAQADCGSLDTAASTLETLQKLSPGASSTHGAAGYLALKLKKYADAESHYLEALKIDPESVHALNNLGVVYLDLYQSGKGRHYQKKSQEMFERAVKTQPTFKQGQKNLAQASEALKIGVPAGGFILIYWIFRIVAGVASGTTSSSVSSGLVPATITAPATGFLLIVANVFFGIAFAAVLFAALACIFKKYRQEIFYQLFTVRGWLFILIPFAFILLLYLFAFLVLEETNSMVFTGIGLAVSAIATFIAGANSINIWRSSRNN